MAISAWKSYPGVEPWSLRVNPSSGDLHPTETHVYVHNVKDVSPGAYHYFVKAHQLEQRAIGDIVPAVWQILGGTSQILPVIIGLNTIIGGRHGNISHVPCDIVISTLDTPCPLSG